LCQVIDMPADDKVRFRVIYRDWEDEEVVHLEDMGMSPTPRGLWNPSNYVTAVDRV
jgi:hypothetical protein